MVFTKSKAPVITRRIFLGLKHDRRSLGMILFAPIIAMCVFGIAFSGEVEDVDVIVVNYDSGAYIPMLNINISFSEKILGNIDTDVLNIKYESDEEKAMEQVENGEINAVIIFPEDFSRTLVQTIAAASGEGNNSDIRSPADFATSFITIRSDNSNVNVANAIIKAFQDALSKTMDEYGVEAPVGLEVDPVYAEDAEFIDMFVPGIMAFAIFLLTTLLTLISFVGERTQGTLERLMATPIKESEIVLGYAMAFGILGTIQAMILMVIGIVVFDIIIVGNVLLAFLIAALLAVVSQAMGILLSSAAKREAQAVQFVPLIVLPAFLLAGIFWPVEAIPTWLRPASYFIPPTYAVSGLRSVMLRGWGLEHVWYEISILLLFALLFLTGAVAMLKRSRR
ncbi:MAG: ABC transporter permease [Thermoplasmata archaeon]|nr:MAG: ABC transporter permease [Thermoplasmata archaeon]